MRMAGVHATQQQRTRRALAAGAALVAMLVLGGCGGATGRTGDPVAGKRVFQRTCAVCHTLADAGSAGVAGPNLDQLQPGRSVVIEQVSSGGGGMPSFEGKLSSQQVADVAAYVAARAGKAD